MSLLIKGAQVYTEHEILSGAGILVADRKIQDILSERESATCNEKNIIELPQDWHLVPGFIDIHIHGAGGADVMDAKQASLRTISKTLAKEGVTTFVATTMSAKSYTIERVIEAVKQFRSNRQEIIGAELIGINLEGPFISKIKAGAQNPNYIQNPNLALLKNWIKYAKNLIKIVTLAPELDNSDNSDNSEILKIIKYLKTTNIIAAIGHSNASFAETQLAIQAGCDHATHLFNAMRNIHHRDPGLVLALLLSEEVTTEIIADGVHVHPPMLQLALRIKGCDKLILITDAMCAKGMADGIYELGGQKVIVENDSVRLENGTLAGSILKMPKAICNIIKFTNCSLQDAIKMAATNPAKKIQVFDRKGSITKNKDADLVVLDSNYRVRLCLCRGRIINASI